MSRQESTREERLNELYKQRKFLKTKLELQIETTNRTKLGKHRNAEIRTENELVENQAEIDKLLEDM